MSDPGNSPNISLDGYTRSLAGLLGEIIWKKHEVENQLKEISSTTTVDVVPLDTKDVQVNQNRSNIVHFEPLKLSAEFESGSPSGTKEATLRPDPVSGLADNNPEPELKTKTDQFKERRNPTACHIESPASGELSILRIAKYNKPASSSMGYLAQEEVDVPRHADTQHPPHYHIPHKKRDVMNRSNNCKCHLCEEVFPNTWILRRHCRTHRNDQNPPFPYLCSTCNEWITCKSEAIHHLSLHGWIRQL